MGLLPLLVFSALILCNIFHPVDLENLHQKPLHHYMTENELKYFFGVKSHLEVPTYDVSFPYEVKETGDPQLLQKRHLTEPENVFYRVPAFGRELHFNLTLNRDLISRDLKVRTTHADGRVSYSPAPKNTYYVGHEMTDPLSTVAVSVAGGLTGMLKLSDNFLFIHPLPSHLAMRAMSSSNTTQRTPHVVYKNTRQFDVDADSGRPQQKLQEALFEKTHVQVKTMKAALMIEEKTASTIRETGMTPAEYLILLANIVSRLLRDPSIGDIRINYVVIHSEIIAREVIGAEFSEKKETWMSKMSSYVSARNTADDQNPAHYDVFSLIYKMVTSVGGSANYATMCKKNFCGNVNNMLGLQSALIAAHEIGHNMGLGHDNGKDCPAGKYIMSYVLPGGPDAETWSRCSRETIQAFLKSSRSSCLNDEAQVLGVTAFHAAVKRALRKDTSFEEKPAEFDSVSHMDLKLPFTKESIFVHNFPGETVSADEQCELQYGANYYQCPNRASECGHLWCTGDGRSCLSKSAPVADGTPCGPRNWCIKGTCVDNGKLAINGSWSYWSDYTQCTKSCDNGVQHRKRTCTKPPPSNGGENCKGDSVGHWRICNILPCPFSAASPRGSYRDEQCIEKRGNASRAFFYGQPCYLYCRLGRTALFMGRVADGTRCYKDPDIHDICIQGQCREVGCDDVLSSGTKLDRCGKCGGKGNTCKWIIGSYLKQMNETGLENADVIVELDQGVLVAKFTEKVSTTNQIGVKVKDGHFITNPDKGRSTKLHKGEATFWISTSKKPFKDTVQMNGPSTVVFQVMYIQRSERNYGIDYRYLQRISLKTEGPRLEYRWIVGEWTECSATCATGEQTREIRCVVKEDESPANIKACGRKISDHQHCNREPCPPEWFVTEWTGCSKTCGSGTQTRKLICRQKVNSFLYDTLNTSRCDADKKPVVSPLYRTCNAIVCTPEWVVTADWSTCSTPCGAGLRTRQVKCFFTDEGGLPTVAADDVCSYSYKPADTEHCNDTRPCLPDENYKCFPASPCKNGGSCFEEPPGYRCVCPRGFEGKQCIERVDPCQRRPCLNNGTCIQHPIKPRTFKCECPHWFQGKFCQKQIYPCDSSPCLSGSTCINDPYDMTKYSCACPEWLTGRNCEIEMTMCDYHPCENSGYCVSDVSISPSYYECYCRQWFTGPTCAERIYPCDSDPCQNGATCVNDDVDLSVYHCTCKEWFAGANCEVQLTSCNSHPCLNGGYCHSSPQNPAKFTCSCGDWFTGKICQDQIFPCDSNPCVNGATCRNDKSDISEFHCDCKEGYFGKKCQVPSFIDIGCFKPPKSGLKEVLQDFGNKISATNVEKYIKRCAELAYDKGYSHFGLGQKNKCKSGADAKTTYYTKGSAKAKLCKGGVGGSAALDVYTFESQPEFVELGCYKENNGKRRLLRKKYASFVNQRDPANPGATILQCAYVARDMNIKYFAVQNYGECWTDEKVADSYQTFQRASERNCKNGIGARLTNYLYHLKV